MFPPPRSSASPNHGAIRSWFTTFPSRILTLGNCICGTMEKSCLNPGGPKNENTCFMVYRRRGRPLWLRGTTAHVLYATTDVAGRGFLKAAAGGAEFRARGSRDGRD